MNVPRLDHHHTSPRCRPARRGRADAGSRARHRPSRGSNPRVVVDRSGSFQAVDNTRLRDAIFELGPHVRTSRSGADRTSSSCSREGLANASDAGSDFFEELLVNPTLLTLAPQRGERRAPLDPHRLRQLRRGRRPHGGRPRLRRRRARRRPSCRGGSGRCACHGSRTSSSGLIGPPRPIRSRSQRGSAPPRTTVRRAPVRLRPSVRQCRMSTCVLPRVSPRWTPPGDVT
jgi:hypothetical protein